MWKALKLLKRHTLLIEVTEKAKNAEVGDVAEDEKVIEGAEDIVVRVAEGGKGL